MIETIGDQNVVVRNYTSNFDIKEYIQDVLIPEAFPTIPINKLNLGLVGIVSEMISQAIEDSAGTAALMMNEAFVTRAVLPESIYSAASLHGLGYTFAVPSQASFAVQIWLPDVLSYATKVTNTNTYRYYLDKDTKIILGDSIYKFPYDIIIDFQYIDGKRVFNVYYDMDETNSISTVTNKYIKHQIVMVDWLLLFLPLQEFDRKVETNSITDNLVTTNSDIILKWTRQIAGIDLVYITPQGQRLSMKLKTEHTKEDVDPFVWYRFIDDNTIALMFSSNKGYFVPEFNSKIESTIYTCNGASSNFDEYDNTTSIPVQRTGDRYLYNAETRIVAACFSGSTGGTDKGNIELLRNNVILASNTANVLTTDADYQKWFNTYGKKYGTNCKFFKRRDDPTGRLFSQFITINNDSYTYPTNTLSINVNHNEFDYVNNNSSGENEEFIIEPGHLWEYDDGDEISRTTVRMITGTSGKPAMITDEILPSISDSRPFMFINPFFIKIFKTPTISANYNCLLNDTSFPEEVPIKTESFYKFQLANLNITRVMSRKSNNVYTIRVVCVSVNTSEDNIKYINGIGNEYPVTENNLRLVLITRTALEGETGYVEMTPVEIGKAGAYTFETELIVYDNLTSDNQLEIDISPNGTKGMISMITNGDKKDRVFIDAAETSFHFACMMKDNTTSGSVNVFNNTFDGYVMTNRFANCHRDLTLYKPMSMMRSVITFEGSNDNYKVNASLMPFLKWDVPLDEAKMKYFIRAFTEQYDAMKPVLNITDGNTFIDFKLYNTYGRSNNYYIGPKDGDDVLWNSDILLDDVNVRIKLRISVNDRSLYTQTVEAVVNEIKSFFDSLNNEERTDIHVSNLIHTIEKNQPNVHYIRFLGFNEYDANKQSIFVKNSDTSLLTSDEIVEHVPEMIRVDSDSVEIVEEV